MPLFDLRCETCGHTWEDLVRRGRLPACEVCGAPEPRKLLTGGITLIGISPSNPIVNERSGLVLETNAQKRAWEVANPHTRLVERKSEDAKAIRQMIEKHEEKNAHRYGFSSARARFQHTKRERDKQLGRT